MTANTYMEERKQRALEMVDINPAKAVAIILADCPLLENRFEFLRYFMADDRPSMKAWIEAAR